MKKIKLNIVSLFLIFIFILFSLQQAEEYLNFHKENRKNIEYQSQLNHQLENFTLDDIQNISDLHIYRTPNLWLLDQIVWEINNAQERVLLETYILTEKRIQEALKKAFSRGIDVQVILEKNPYMAYSINNKSYNNLLNSGIPVVWSDPKDYSLNHSKFLIVDSNFYVSTWNYSYSTFKYNRDFFIKSSDIKLFNKILEVYNFDYIWEEKHVYHTNLVLSPFNSRNVFEQYFQSAIESIDLYFQYFKDDELVDLLIEKQKSWIQVTAIIPKTALESNIDEIERMSEAWIQFHVMKKYKMHSKVILIDKLYWFIWSINFSNYSIDKNRELWLLIKNPEKIKEIINYFQDDIANNTVKK